MDCGCGVGVVARTDGCREARDLPAGKPSWRHELRLTGGLAAWLYSRSLGGYACSHASSRLHCVPALREYLL